MKLPNITNADLGWSNGTICPAKFTNENQRLSPVFVHPAIYPSISNNFFGAFFHVFILSQVKEFKNCKTPGVFTTTSYWPLYTKTLIFFNVSIKSVLNENVISAENALKIF